MVNPNSTNALDLWNKMQEMAKEIVGARKLGRKDKQTKPNSKRGTRASVVYYGYLNSTNVLGLWHKNARED